ncbi:unnamed protein product, partial [Prorocentrum cordatum]
MVAAGARPRGAKEAWAEEEPWGVDGDHAEWEEAQRKGKRRKPRQEGADLQEEAWTEEAARKVKRRKQPQDEAWAEDGWEEPDEYHAAAPEGPPPAEGQQE